MFTFSLGGSTFTHSSGVLNEALSSKDFECDFSSWVVTSGFCSGEVTSAFSSGVLKVAFPSRDSGFALSWRDFALSSEGFNLLFPLDLLRSPRLRNLFSVDLIGTCFFVSWPSSENSKLLKNPTKIWSFVESLARKLSLNFFRGFTSSSFKSLVLMVDSTLCKKKFSVWSSFWTFLFLPPFTDDVSSTTIVMLCSVFCFSVSSIGSWPGSYALFNAPSVLAVDPWRAWRK